MIKFGYEPDKSRQKKIDNKTKQLVVHLGRHKVLKKDINPLGSIYSSSFLAIDYCVLPYINKTYILSRDDILIHVYSCVKINLLYKKPKICYLCFILIIIACHSARRSPGDYFLHLNLACLATDTIYLYLKSGPL